MSQEKEMKSKSGQLDQVLSDIDVLDNADTNVFRIDSDTFKLAGIEFKLIEDYREAFDMEMMENRFTDYLLKYDYIVGDIAYEKLRLRGFFEDYRKSVPIDMKISNLEDYLVEYCSFGCSYFVFERVEKKKEDPEPYFKPRKSKRSKKSNRSKPQQSNKRKPNPNQKQNQKKQNPQSKNQKQTQQNKQKEFQVVKKDQDPQNKNTNQNKNKNRPEPKKQTQKTQFKIRKKNV